MPFFLFLLEQNTFVIDFANRDKVVHLYWRFVKRLTHFCLIDKKEDINQKSCFDKYTEYIVIKRAIKKT